MFEELVERLRMLDLEVPRRGDWINLGFLALATFVLAVAIRLLIY